MKTILQYNFGRAMCRPVLRLFITWLSSKRVYVCGSNQTPDQLIEEFLTSVPEVPLTSERG